MQLTSTFKEEEIRTFFDRFVNAERIIREEEEEGYEEEEDDTDTDGEEGVEENDTPTIETDTAIPVTASDARAIPGNSGAGRKGRGGRG
jgi:hypothetical protein